VAQPQRHVDERPEEEEDGTEADEARVAEREQERVREREPGGEAADGREHRSRQRERDEREPGPADPARLVGRQAAGDHPDRDDDGAQA